MAASGFRSDIHRLSETLARALAEEGLGLDLGPGVVVGTWLVSEPAAAGNAPLDPTAFCPAFPAATLNGEGWGRHQEGDTFLTYLRQLNDHRQMVLAACGIVVPRETAVVVRLYSKKDIRVWLNGDPVFVGQREIKAIDDLIFVSLRPGLNVFMVEKLATSLKFTVEEGDSSHKTMAAYLTPAYLRRVVSEIRMVPERLLGAEPVFSCLLLPRNRCGRGIESVHVRAFAPDGRCLWSGRAPVGSPFTVEVPGYEGPLELDAEEEEGGDGWGRQWLLIGDVEVQLRSLRRLFAEHRAEFGPRAAEDVDAWIADLEDIWRTEETPAYEPRRWFIEEVAALCGAMGRLKCRIEGIRSAKPDNDLLNHGLVLHAFRSRLDDTRQSYYAYIPRDDRPGHPHPVVVLLKYLYKKVQLPGFAFDPVLADLADRAGVIFLSPFGRGINRYEYAGETDLIEALEDLGARYLLEPGRVFLAGFSMGGGAAFTLVQKYPGRFAGAVGWSCNIMHRYAANLSGKRLVYLSGARDTMFDYPGNHAILDGLRHDRGAEVVVNHRLAGGHHFSLHNIHNDVMLAHWASMTPETEVTESGCFLTDDLRYRDAGLVEVREAIRPGELSEVSYRRKGGGLDIRTRNVERLKVRRPADIVRVTVNGTGIGSHIDGECEVAGLGGMGGAVGKPTDEDLNATGSGIAEIYYGPVTIVEGDWREGRTNPAQKWAKRLAKAMARPVYYGDFREKYAVIPVLSASACELADLEGRSLVLVGSRNENRWLRHLEHAIGARPLMENLAAAVDRPVCAMVFKTRGLWPGTRTVFALVEDGAALAAFADSDLFKGQFTPPFAGQAALLRHDALVLCRDGEMHAFRFDARWTPIPLALTNPGVPHDRFS